MIKQILCVIAMVVGLSGCQTSPLNTQIVGEVLYKQRIALPADSVIQIQLQDVSLQDVKAVVLAEYELSPVTGITPFEFVVPTEAFKTGHRYAISARITVADELWFINTQSYPVNITDPQPLTVVVDKVKR
ncbi:MULTISPECIES: YbaY family lipoprotein [Pseudomonadati]|uniref:YbaY family lipoprotein n=1 Tax=Shewanella aestuarii TaxID=1028752 RepID=A0ABT0KW57_9GAMM|nr:YbaY family lipoprotein [Shewanella aestuarii]MCL1115682.1 YbaY family lipoprotein [Shewanella aestuarii]GGN68254.1 lipoprotein [Shewanella aestuarii]